MSSWEERQAARTTSKGQSDAQLLLSPKSPKAMRVQPSWPTWWWTNMLTAFRSTGIEMMKRLGMDIPSATVSDWFKDVADLLRHLYYRIRDLVMDTDYIQADETTVPIVDNEKHRTVKGYLWQICAVTQKLLSFHYDKGSRSKDVALGLFAHFRGGRSRRTAMPCTTIMKARTGSCALTAGPIHDFYILVSVTVLYGGTSSRENVPIYIRV